MTNLLRSALLLFALLLLVACGEDQAKKPSADGGGSNTEAGSGQCSYNGRVYQTGDSFCATDGCNACQCNPEGSVGVGCTMKDCAAAGVVVADVCEWGVLPAECPEALPELESSCDLDDPQVICNYFYRESQCDYLDIYWHCTCEDSVWSCWDDKEDCYFGRDGGV